MHNKMGDASFILNPVDEFIEELIAVEIVDAHSALNGDGNADLASHGLKYLHIQLGVLH